MRTLRRIVLLSLAAASSLLFCAAPSTAPGPSIPPIPISVSAMGVSMSAILVTWVKILNVASYRVFKSTSDTGAFAVVATVTNNTYYDTGLVPGSTFYYKVSALNDLGESGQSAEVLATTAVPGKVSARLVSPASIVVTWTLVTGATSYNVYRDTSDTGTFSFSRTVSTDTLVDSGLAAGTRYYYKITAKNIAGESGPSFIKNAITIPATPAGAGAAGISNSCIVIAWPAVTGAASYKIYRNTVDTGAFQLTGSATRDTFSDTSLSAATTYYYKISAVNSSGESGPSASCSAITKKLRTPNNVSAAAVSSSGITIIWPAVAGAASYTVYRSTIDTGTYSVIDSVATDTFSDTSLIAGATYFYKIRAVDSSGESGLSAPFTVITIPGVPVGVSASAVSSSAIKITWPVVTGAASFKVYRSDIDTGTYSVIDSVAKDTFNDTGLVAGATYYYKVTGINVSGESKQSAPVSATTLLTGFIPFIRPSLQFAME
jgi:fibronectin type 3 domain-containing protein